MHNERMINHPQKNVQNCGRQSSEEYTLPKASHFKTKRINRNDNLQWTPMWGPPL